MRTWAPLIVSPLFSRSVFQSHTICIKLPGGKRESIKNVDSYLNHYFLEEFYLTYVHTALSLNPSEQLLRKGNRSLVGT